MCERKCVGFLKICLYFLSCSSNYIFLTSNWKIKMAIHSIFTCLDVIYSYTWSQAQIPQMLERLRLWSLDFTLIIQLEWIARIHHHLPHIRETGSKIIFTCTLIKFFFFRPSKFVNRLVDKIICISKWSLLILVYNPINHLLDNIHVSLLSILRYNHITQTIPHC